MKPAFRLLGIVCLTFVGLAAAAGQPYPERDFMTLLAARLRPAETAVETDAAASIDELCGLGSETVARRIVAEYGAVFVSRVDHLPSGCAFRDAGQARSFRERVRTAKAAIEGIEIELQQPAMNALLQAAAVARQHRLRIAPLDGAIAGARTFEDTVKIWNKRFFPALEYWSRKGKITDEEAALAVNATPVRSLAALIEWESRGLLFGTARSSSIFSSAAPPGASQHLLLLAFDVRPPISSKLVTILAEHGWHRTVRGDSVHFTYLGADEAELPALGLERVRYRGEFYWVPKLPAPPTAR
ncbi:MAG: hypothetical protein ACK4S4_09425 [Pyrinomonadaceae bacterium]